jgi:hypothetical protein
MVCKKKTLKLDLSAKLYQNNWMIKSLTCFIFRRSPERNSKTYSTVNVTNSLKVFEKKTFFLLCRLKFKGLFVYVKARDFKCWLTWVYNFKSDIVPKKGYIRTIFLPSFPADYSKLFLCSVVERLSRNSFHI